jgi:hypothetical protein
MSRGAGKGRREPAAAGCALHAANRSERIRKLSVQFEVRSRRRAGLRCGTQTSASEVEKLVPQSQVSDAETPSSVAERPSLKRREA